VAAASLVGLGSIADLIRDHRRWARPLSIRYPRVHTFINSRVAVDPHPAPPRSQHLAVDPPPGAPPLGGVRQQRRRRLVDDVRRGHLLGGQHPSEGAGRVVNDEAARDPRPSRGISRGRGSRRPYHSPGGAPQAQTSLSTRDPVTGCGGHVGLGAAPSAPFPHSGLAVRSVPDVSF